MSQVAGSGVTKARSAPASHIFRSATVGPRAVGPGLVCETRRHACVRLPALLS